MRKHPFGYLEPVEKPTAESLRAYYAEKYFQLSMGNYRASYSADELRYFEAKLKQKRKRLEDLRGSAPGRLLDVGCGEGFALAHFERLGWQVEGLDYSLDGVSTMNSHVKAFVTTGDVNVLLEDRLQSSLRYDAVWLTNVLEHVLDPSQLLDRLRRIVAPGGLAVVTVPNDFSLFQQHLLNSGIVRQPYWIALPDHLAYFDKDSLVATSEATGWRCLDVLSEFPIEWYLLHSGSNYVRDRALGAEAHRARIAIENLLDRQPTAKVNAFYRAMADVGMGRNLVAFLTPASE